MAYSDFTYELHPTFDAEDEQVDEAFMEELQVNIMEWFRAWEGVQTGADPFQPFFGNRWTLLQACASNGPRILSTSTTGNSHDARILARAIHNPEIEFPQPVPGKYYLVDSKFAHRPGYIAPYKGSDILYHFQQFYDGDTGRRRNFRNAREKFNFRHSSCRNVIKRAFGV
ncbi:uncharacterized protein LOC111372947 [Olea europaea var. sylvestris]|uniref:uncharacterized protein LOC111372947 n=1 Tax=Olea europaea var. sylvestris TaxID=158386 RepID=UPI000C1D7FB7|nr:uncharacterized protein LOC111372947 [Olea europaea var. sylvestris]